MSRRVSHDGAGTLSIRFPFDRSLVDRIKTLPNRRWNASGRYWSVPQNDVVLVVDLLSGENFKFDGATRELYKLMGGTGDLPEAAPERSGPTLPGLFDDAEDDAESSERSPDYTVSQLNEKVRQVIEDAFPSTIWLVGEISGFNKSAHKRHVTFHLVEPGEGGRSVSEVSATLFERTRQQIDRTLRAAGAPFRLEDEITVRLEARVELYVPWGSYRVIVEDLDVNYTLGEAARRREEIIRRLTEAGLLEINRALPLPVLPLRVGLVTSLGSDAYNDVRRSLQESGYAFRLTAHGARVQGHATEPSVLNALDWFRARAEKFDVVLICRGGGSRTDLSWFDSEPLGRAVATFPLPVVVGIGHEQDHSVLDAVARRAKTPTAAAGLLVEAVRTSERRVEETGRELLEQAAALIGQRRQESLERLRRLVLVTRGRLRGEARELHHRARRLVTAARGLTAAARRNLVRWAAAIPRTAARSLGEQRGFLSHSVVSILKNARRGLDVARRTIDLQARLIGPRGRRLLLRETERTESRQRRLRLVHPERVVERGYSILRLEDGSVLTRATRAPAGTGVRAELREGALNLRSEGPESG